MKDSPAVFILHPSPFILHPLPFRAGFSESYASTPLGASMNQATRVWSVTDPTLFKPGVYQALGTINGGEVISSDAY